ncbi:hypothetical protein GCM10027605_47140 [Micromonospora zhanjiangensis]
MGDRLVEQVFTALDTQTVVVPGSTAAETILPRLADSLRELLKQRDQALVDPLSRAYYDRNRAEGKKHSAALICLARRRVDVLHAMLRAQTLYQHKPAEELALAA